MSFPIPIKKLAKAVKLASPLIAGILLGACGSDEDADTTGPVISLQGSEVITLPYGQSWSDAGYSATDDVDGAVGVTVNGTVDVNKVGTYIISYTATDAEGNSSLVKRTVNVVDTLKPTISLTGEPELSLLLNQPYNELGAMASDEYDGDIEPIVSGEVDITTAGTYILTYSATDSSANVATVTRTVTVIEQSAQDIASTEITEFISKLNGALALAHQQNNGAFLEPENAEHQSDINKIAQLVSPYFADDFLNQAAPKASFVKQLVSGNVWTNESMSLRQVEVDKITTTEQEGSEPSATIELYLTREGYQRTAASTTETWQLKKDAQLGWQLLGDQSNIAYRPYSTHCSKLSYKEYNYCRFSHYFNPNARFAYVDLTDAEARKLAGVTTSMKKHTDTGALIEVAELDYQAATLEILSKTGEVKQTLYFKENISNAVNDNRYNNLSLFNPELGEFYQDFSIYLGDSSWYQDKLVLAPELFEVGGKVRYRAYKNAIDYTNPQQPVLPLDENTLTIEEPIEHSVHVEPDFVKPSPQTVAELANILNVTDNKLTVSWQTPPSGAEVILVAVDANIYRTNMGENGEEEYRYTPRQYFYPEQASNSIDIDLSALNLTEAIANKTHQTANGYGNDYIRLRINVFDHNNQSEYIYSHYVSIASLVGISEPAQFKGDLTAQMAKVVGSVSGKVDIDDNRSERMIQPQTNVAGQYGLFSINEYGRWNYQLDTSATVTDPVTETFTVTSVDGTSEELRVQIWPGNEAFHGGLVANVAPGFYGARGVLQVFDKDGNPGQIQPQTNVSTQYGKFTIDQDGKWYYLLNEGVPVFDEEDSLTEEFTITSALGSIANFKVFIFGSVRNYVATVPSSTEADSVFAVDFLRDFGISQRDVETGKLTFKVKNTLVNDTASIGMTCDRWNFDSKRQLAHFWLAPEGELSMWSAPLVPGGSYANGMADYAKDEFGKYITENVIFDQKVGQDQWTDVELTWDYNSSYVRPYLTLKINGQIASSSHGAIPTDPSQPFVAQTLAGSTIYGCLSQLRFTVPKSDTGLGALYIDDIKLFSNKTADIVYDRPDYEEGFYNYMAGDLVALTRPSFENITTENVVVETMVLGHQPTRFSGDLFASMVIGELTDNIITGTASVYGDAFGAWAFQAQTNTPTNYGSFSIGENGEWSYNLDESKPALNALVTTLTDKVLVKAQDGTEQVVTILIRGSGVTFEPSGYFTTNQDGSLATKMSVDAADLVSAFTLLAPTPEQAFAKPVLEQTTTYGRVTISEQGLVTYALDRSQDLSALYYNEEQAVQEGFVTPSLTDSFVVESIGGSQVTVNVTIEGALLVPAVISGMPAYDDIENISTSQVNANVSATSGLLTIADNNLGQASFQPLTDLATAYGLFSIDAAGSWNYSLTAESVSLIKDGSLVLPFTESIEVSSIDGTKATVPVSIVEAESQNLNLGAQIAGTGTGTKVWVMDLPTDTAAVGKASFTLRVPEEQTKDVKVQFHGSEWQGGDVKVHLLSMALQPRSDAIFILDGTGTSTNNNSVQLDQPLVKGELMKFDFTWDGSADTLAANGNKPLLTLKLNGTPVSGNVSVSGSSIVDGVFTSFSTATVDKLDKGPSNFAIWTKDALPIDLDDFVLYSGIEGTTEIFSEHFDADGMSVGGEMTLDYVNADLTNTTAKGVEFPLVVVDKFLRISNDVENYGGTTLQFPKQEKGSVTLDVRMSTTAQSGYLSLFGGTSGSQGEALVDFDLNKYGAFRVRGTVAKPGYIPVIRYPMDDWFPVEISWDATGAGTPTVIMKLNDQLVTEIPDITVDANGSFESKSSKVEDIAEGIHRIAFKCGYKLNAPASVCDFDNVVVKDADGVVVATETFDNLEAGTDAITPDEVLTSGMKTLGTIRNADIVEKQ